MGDYREDREKLNHLNSITGVPGGYSLEDIEDITRYEGIGTILAILFCASRYQQDVIDAAQEDLVRRLEANEGIYEWL
jgi:hypothetical protein